MDSEILDLIQQRDKLFQCFKKSGKDDDYNSFCKLRNKVQREIKGAKSEFFKDKIEENKSNPKKTLADYQRFKFEKQKKRKQNCV